MNTIVVVNGSLDWSEFFPGDRVRQMYVQNTRWMLSEGRLWIQDRSGTVCPDGIIWRLGAVTPHPSHRTCLELIRAAQVPCCNPAQTLLRSYDRLSMMIELQEAGLPIAPLHAVVGPEALSMCAPDFPVVVKSGSLHAGQGKARAQSADVWDDLVSLLEPLDTYTTLEPFVEYTRDLRCLAVGDEIWSMERSAQGWKANVDTTDYALVPTPPKLRAWTTRAMEHFGADTLGLDFLCGPEDTWVLLESNEIPGVLGFPRDVCAAIALRLKNRMESRQTSV